jgi:site-specific recombinase XerD
MGNDLIIMTGDVLGDDGIIAEGIAVVPVQVAAAGDQAARRFVEFFTANIRNRNTRASYARAISNFFRWCERVVLQRLDVLEPVHVAAYIEQLGQTHSAPSVKQRFCRAYDELRNFLRPRSRHQHVPADRRRLLLLRRSVTVLGILQAV